MLEPAWIAVTISLLTFTGGVLMWYSGTIQKRYAAQRDYEHLKRNYEQLTQGLEELAKSQEEGLYDIALEMKELKGLMQAIFVRLTPTVDTSGWMRKKEGD